MKPPKSLWLRTFLFYQLLVVIALPLGAIGSYLVAWHHLSQNTMMIICVPLVIIIHAVVWRKWVGPIPWDK